MPTKSSPTEPTKMVSHRFKLTTIAILKEAKKQSRIPVNRIVENAARARAQRLLRVA